MKTLLKLLVVIVAILIALLFILPVAYKSEIINLTKHELNKNVNATIDFEDADISLIKSFPNFNISIYEFNIIGKGEFKNDTLIKIKKISMAVDIFSVINTNNYKIKNIGLISPVANIKVLANGHVNYDIAMPDDISVKSTDNKSNNLNNDTATGFYFDINKFRISNGEINYYDAKKNIKLNVKGLNHILSGKLNADKAILNTNTKIAALNLSYQNVAYISKVAINYRARINANIKDGIYTLGNNELIVNNLALNFDGSVSSIEDGLNLVLSFNSKGNKFKDILSLVPAIYAHNFNEVKTTGTFSVNGFVKGTYNDTHIPAFNISASVENARFKYPDLPKSVQNINIKANISNKGGDADNTIIDIKKIDLQLGDDQFSASAKVSNPFSDPKIDMRAIGDINLYNIKSYYPIDYYKKLRGTISFNVKFDGRLSSIEDKNNITTLDNDNSFVAMGSIVAKGINFIIDEVNDPINIIAAQLNFSPQYIDLVNLKVIIGKSDLEATGKINNYLSYYFNNGVLEGSLISNSIYMNIDKLLAHSTDKNSPQLGNNQSGSTNKPQNKSNSIVELPSNVNFNLKAQFSKLIYDSLNMDNVTGKLTIANNVLQLDNLIMDAVDGKMIVNGSYSTIKPDKPDIDFQINMKNLSIPKAYNNFAIIRNYLPLAKKTTGLLSANFRLSTTLDTKMMPIYSTMNGKGTLSTSKITINDLNSLIQVAEKLNLTEFKHLEIAGINIGFKFVDGKLVVKPTKFSYKNIDGEIEGWTGFDKSIGYTLKVKVPRKEFGDEANKLLDGLLAQANSYGANFTVSDKIPISIFIDGTIDNPKVSTTFTKENSKKAVKNTEQVIKEVVKNEKDKFGKDASAKAKQIIDDANKQAKQIIEEAEKQAKLIKENASKAKKDLLSETDKQAKALIAEGKKNGVIAEMAANEAAKQLVSGVQNNADNIIKEANKKADDIIKTAKATSAKLRKEADIQAKKVGGTK